MTSAREVSINLRARRGQRDLIDRATEIQGKNRSEFMLQAACEKAQEVRVTSGPSARLWIIACCVRTDA